MTQNDKVNKKITELSFELYPELDARHREYFIYHIVEAIIDFKGRFEKNRPDIETFGHLHNFRQKDKIERCAIIKLFVEDFNSLSNDFVKLQKILLQKSLYSIYLDNDEININLSFVSEKDIENYFDIYGEDPVLKLEGFFVETNLLHTLFKALEIKVLD